MPEAVIVAIARSPIGRAYKGSLATVRPDDLAAQIIRAALDQVPALDVEDIGDLMIGCAEPAGEAGFNLGRIVAVNLGYDRLPGTVVNRFCASSLQTTRMAFHAIRAGEGEAFISAGVESVTSSGRVGSADSWPNSLNSLYAEAQSRTAAVIAAGTLEWHDPRQDGLLPDTYISMGQTAENVAFLCDVSREDMDHFAVRSQNLAEQALVEGFWKTDITPITLPDGTVISADDSPRAGTTYEEVAALKPVFRETGRVTAGNCCPLNDGAAALVILSDIKAAELALKPLARIVSTGVSALSPEIMGLGPVEATKRALALAGMSLSDIDLVEMNEAFASQVLASQRELCIDMDQLNVAGGAIALGHPFGMTGARITSTLIHLLQSKDKQFGLETMCVGGGQGMAMLIERLS